MKFEQVEDSEIIELANNYNFGSSDPVQLVKNSLAQIAGSFSTGHSVSTILSKLGLITPAPNFNITKRGRRQSYYWTKAQLSTTKKEARREALGEGEARLKSAKKQIVLLSERLSEIGGYTVELGAALRTLDKDSTTREKKPEHCGGECHGDCGQDACPGDEESEVE